MLPLDHFYLNIIKALLNFFCPIIRGIRRFRPLKSESYNLIYYFSKFVVANTFSKKFPNLIEISTCVNLRISMIKCLEVSHEFEI